METVLFAELVKLVTNQSTMLNCERIKRETHYITYCTSLGNRSLSKNTWNFLLQSCWKVAFGIIRVYKRILYRHLYIFQFSSIFEEVVRSYILYPLRICKYHKLLVRLDFHQSSVFCHLNLLKMQFMRDSKASSQTW